jgi:putative hemolysin
MKALLLIPFILLVGCSNPEPMSQAEAAAVKACLEQGYKPTFDIQTNGRRVFDCGDQ